MKKSLYALVPSLVINLLFALLFVLAVSARTGSFMFSPLDKDSVDAAQIVSVMPGSGVVFNGVDVTLEKGKKAVLQFSNRFNGAQSNYRLDTLYDHAVISVEPGAYGVVITALARGETTMQTVSNEGIVNIARVTVK
jgi:hypothetical protein